MRRFIVLGHTQRAEAPLPLNDPAGAGGRWDLLARCVTNALLVSHGVRRDAEILLVLQSVTPARTVRVVGAEIRNLNPDERSTVALLSKALEARDVGAHESTPLPGIHVARRSLDEVLASVVRDGTCVWLSESGSGSLDGLGPSSDVTFVLGDHRDPTPQEAEALRRHGARGVSLGPLSLHADQCITVVHHWMDVAPASTTPPS